MAEGETALKKVISQVQIPRGKMKQHVTAFGRAVLPFLRTLKVPDNQIIELRLIVSCSGDQMILHNVGLFPVKASAPKKTTAHHH
jgi:hypothetical protein